jgi:hypothetical protein
LIQKKREKERNVSLFVIEKISVEVFWLQIIRRKKFNWKRKNLELHSSTKKYKHRWLEKSDE